MPKGVKGDGLPARVIFEQSLGGAAGATATASVIVLPGETSVPPPASRTADFPVHRFPPPSVMGIELGFRQRPGFVPSSFSMDADSRFLQGVSRGFPEGFQTPINFGGFQTPINFGVSRGFPGFPDTHQLRGFGVSRHPSTSGFPDTRGDLDTHRLADSDTHRLAEGFRHQGFRHP
jgi:hypothetical protein